MRLHRLKVERGVERHEPPLIELDPGEQKVALRARDDHTDVDELRALDLRHDANYRVVIRDEIAHASPPRETLAAIRADSVDMTRRPAGPSARLPAHHPPSRQQATTPRRPR